MDVNNNSKLPDDFSDHVMASINKKIVARDRRENRIMYLSVAVVGLLLLGVIVFLASYYEWFSDLTVDFDLKIRADSFVNIVWIIVFVNALVLLGLYSYFSRKLLRNN